MKRKGIIALSMAVSCVLLASPASASPKGAVKLTADKIFENNGYHCGQIKGSWIAGKMIKNGFFYSHAAERKNIVAQARFATGNKKKKLNSKAKNLKGLMAARNPACAGGPGNGNPGNPTPTPTTIPGGQALKFNFSEAVGLALGNPSISSSDIEGVSGLNNGIGSNMRKVKGTGEMEEVVTSGAATISKFLIAPNDKIYALFSQATNLSDSSSSGTCLLAEIDKTTGDPVCIDDSLSSIDWLNVPGGKAIQFDQAGNIYYLGRNSSFNQVLRKNVGGEKIDLINDNIQVSNFLVLADGRVIISGTTGITNAAWVRRISASGGLTNLYTSSNAQFIRQFPDGNIYMGVWGTAIYGIGRYLTASDAIDPQVYITGEGMNGITWNPVYDATPFCDNGQAATYPGFCGLFGASVKGIHRTTANKVYAIAGYSDQGVLMEYYPTLARPTTVVRKVSIFQGVINHLILAGLNAQDKNVMTLFDTSDDLETELIGASNEIEVYRINYLADENKIMFDGLRFSDNKYVLGQVDLDTMEVNASQTGSSKLEDFQIF